MTQVRKSSPPAHKTIEPLVAWVVLLAVLLLNALALRAELAISRVDLNDNASHFAIIERISQAIERGENPLDCWSSEWTLGYPVLRTYQPLAHFLVVGVWLLLGKAASLMSVFVWLRFLAVSLLPLNFFIAARLLGMRPAAAAAAALLSPLISTHSLYGLEYTSYVWAGSGLFPQSVATHFLLLSIGFGYRALRKGSALTLAGALLGLTFLAHFIYGYIGAISLCVLALMPDAEISRIIRIGRTVWVGAAAAAVAAVQLVPLLVDRTVNHSRWEPVWKWDSFGAGQVLGWLFQGELLDHGRLPVLTLLAFGGAGWVLWKRYKLRRADQVDLFLLLGACVWIAIFFGRPFWGRLLELIGALPDLPLHRVIGAVQIFLILLAALAIAAAEGELARRRRLVVLPFVLVLVLYPAIRERMSYLEQNAEWGRRNLIAYEVAKPAIDATIQVAKERGGRVYPGLAASWGSKFKIGDVPFYAFLSTAQVPAVAFLYHSMALTSDVMVLFNDSNPAQYRLFDIQTVVAPAQSAPPLPPFLVPLERIGRFQVLAAPGGGYFDLVDAAAAVRVTRSDFYDVNSRWLNSPWPELRQYLLLDWTGDTSLGLPRVSAEGALPTVAPGMPAGEIVREKSKNEIYEAEFRSTRNCYLLFKMTWHPNWQAELDGKRVPTVTLSPGFVAVPVGPGDHNIRFQYSPEAWRNVVLAAGMSMLCLLAAGEGFVRRAKQRNQPVAVSVHSSRTKKLSIET